VIFYHNAKQKEQAVASMKRLAKEQLYKDSIVTEILPFTNFYPAEKYHQNYYDNNPEYPYCSIIISPKIKKLLEKFGKELKEEYK
jgi:peptide-methionine (S)-S-oxide reductase